jgi:hypothetical protein
MMPVPAEALDVAEEQPRRVPGHLERRRVLDDDDVEQTGVAELAMIRR